MKAGFTLNMKSLAEQRLGKLSEREWGFLKRLIEAPEDHDTTQVYADWLEDEKRNHAGALMRQTGISTRWACAFSVFHAEAMQLETRVFIIDVGSKVGCGAELAATLALEMGKEAFPEDGGWSNHSVCVTPTSSRPMTLDWAATLK